MHRIASIVVLAIGLSVAITSAQQPSATGPYKVLKSARVGGEGNWDYIYADPAVTRNCHSIEVDSDSARFTLSIENVPSENPKTGKNVALSVIAALRKIHAPLAVGT